MANIYRPQSLVLGDLLIYDVAWVRGGIVIVTQQPHSPKIDFTEIRVDGKAASRFYSNSGLEPSTVLFFDNQGRGTKRLQYLEAEEEVVPSVCCVPRMLLASVTVCKDDYRYASYWMQYHKRHGVGHFLIYYNGTIDSSVERAFGGEDATLVEWPFEYWIPLPRSQKSVRASRANEWVCRHGCQPAALCHSVHVLGRGAEWLLNHDLDEYLVSDLPIVRQLKNGMLEIPRTNVWIDGMVKSDPSTWDYSRAKASDASLLPKYLIRRKSIVLPRIHDCLVLRGRPKTTHQGYLMHLIQCSSIRKTWDGSDGAVKPARISPLRGSAEGVDEDAESGRADVSGACRTAPRQAALVAYNSNMIDSHDWRPIRPWHVRIGGFSGIRAFVRSLLVRIGFKTSV